MPSMAFATGMQARLPLGPLTRGFLTTPQASLDAADWPVAPRPASTPGSRPTPGAALPGTLASPQAGHPPASCRELALGYTFNLPSISAPELLDAHSARIVRSWPRGLVSARSGRRVARPATPGSSQGRPKAGPKDRAASLTRPPSAAVCAAWPRQRSVRGREQGPGRGAAGEAVPSLSLNPPMSWLRPLVCPGEGSISAAET